MYNIFESQCVCAYKRTELRTSNVTHSLFLFILLPLQPVQARSPFRIDHTLPSIKVKAKNSATTFSQENSHLEHYPFFETYDEKYLLTHKLPCEPITRYTDSTRFFSGTTLHGHLDYLVCEVRKGKKKYTHFKIVQDKNFNYKLSCGLLVLKHKHLPFIVKLFIEHPETLVHPTWKGFDPVFFFYMAGGVNRHFAGFTRIKNREYIATWAEQNEKWQNKILLPRKWFWLPRDPQWMTIEGKNMSTQEAVESITIPGTYAVVADYFNFKEPRELRKKRKNIIMDFCNDIKLNVDPHENNFMVIKNKKTGTVNVAIIDTEHFPTMVGIYPEEQPTFNNHFEWIVYLASKCLQDTFFRTKSMRLAAKKRQRRKVG